MLHLCFRYPGLENEKSDNKLVVEHTTMLHLQVQSDQHGNLTEFSVGYFCMHQLL